MKKIIAFISIGLFVLTGCSSKEATKSSHDSTNSSKTSEIKKENSTDTSSSNSSSQVSASSSSTSVSSTIVESTSVVEYSATSTQPALENTTSSNPLDSLIRTPEQAEQQLYALRPETRNLSIILFTQIDSDYLFKGSIPSWVQNGSSGTAGFFRVKPTGEVYDTYANGTIIQ